MISSKMELPSKGHLEKVLHIFGYLKKYHNDAMVFYSSETSVSHKYFKREDWYSNSYGYIEE